MFFYKVNEVLRNMIYKGEYLNEISFPLGGIGSGSIGLSGNGMLMDWEIFNRPNKGSINPYSFLAVVAEYPNGKRIIKALQGDKTNELSGRYTGRNGFGYGIESSTMSGVPHFKNVVFEGTFPIAKLVFSDEDFPGKVELVAWNPFIPHDSDNSSIPAAFFEVKIKRGNKDIKYSILFSLRNPFAQSENHQIESKKYTGIMLCNAIADKSDKEYGDLCIAMNKKDGMALEYWYRGPGRDNITVFWRELEENKLTKRKYDTPGKNDICTLMTDIKPNESVKFVLSWNIPNCYNYWDEYKDENGNDITWKNYYATLFSDSVQSCLYSLDNYDKLFKRTKAFKDTLFSSTLDPAIIDAVSSTISVLKSSTVMRLENGALYGFEGTHEHAGSCEGTCTHVWSYAYALCFLFPDLERSIRETEFEYDTAETGRMNFRTKLPLGRKELRRPHCLDGQMLSVVKAYREWKISGDNEWLGKYWSTIKKIISYAWSEENYGMWDRDKDGVLEGQMHHTLDTDLFGPSSWLEGIYLLALKAGEEMAVFFGEPDTAKEYSDLFNNGYNYMKNNLFNGEYFIQNIDLHNREYIDRFDCESYWFDEKQELKFQIGEGCEIDQMLAQWHSNILGLGNVFDADQKKIALRNLFKNNFKDNLRSFANIWRIYALNGESGTIICSYPNGRIRPIIPVQYNSECMTGFEYSFAGLLISEGMYDEGILVVKAVRNRYDGKKRNPWNELECGGNYARSMASFALIPIISGFKFDMPNKSIGFAPIIEGDFKCIFSVCDCYGMYEKTDKTTTLLIKEGSLTISSIELDYIGKVKEVKADGHRIDFVQKCNKLIFEQKCINHNLVILEGD